MRTCPFAALWIALMPLAGALSGCPPESGDAAAGAGAGRAAPAVQQIPRDPARPVRTEPALHLDVYRMTVPGGAISRNEEFWKRIDEQRVDPATDDLLLKNGIRVGVAPNDDWDYFRDILEANHADSAKGTASAGGSGSIELTMKKGITSEDIFYLSDRDKLYGRTYEKCDNLLGISFWPEPRRRGEVRVSISPTIRALRTHFEFKMNGEEREIQEVRPEYLYDLNLRVVIPVNSFLVLSPSTEGKWPTSVGNTFFRSEAPAEQQEVILVLVPRVGSTAARPAPQQQAPSAPEAHGSKL